MTTAYELYTRSCSPLSFGEWVSTPGNLPEGFTWPNDLEPEEPEEEDPDVG